MTFEASAPHALKCGAGVVQLGTLEERWKPGLHHTHESPPLGGKHFVLWCRTAPPPTLLAACPSMPPHAAADVCSRGQGGGGPLHAVGSFHHPTGAGQRGREIRLDRA